MRSSVSQHGAFVLHCEVLPSGIPSDLLCSVTDAITSADSDILAGGNYKESGNWTGRLIKRSHEGDWREVLGKIPNPSLVIRGDDIYVFYGKGSIAVQKSSDGGEHWQAQDVGPLDASGWEPSAILLPDERILVAFESETGRTNGAGRAIRTAVLTPGNGDGPGSWTKSMERGECWGFDISHWRDNFEDAHLSFDGCNTLFLTFEEESVDTYHVEAESSAGFLRSDDNGETWSAAPRWIVADGFNNDGPKLLIFKHTELMCFWLRDDFRQHISHLACRRSLDEGETWGEIEYISPGYGNVGVRSGAGACVFFSTSEPPSNYPKADEVSLLVEVK